MQCAACRNCSEPWQELASTHRSVKPSSGFRLFAFSLYLVSISFTSTPRTFSSLIMFPLPFIFRFLSTFLYTATPPHYRYFTPFPSPIPIIHYLWINVSSKAFLYICLPRPFPSHHFIAFARLSALHVSSLLSFACMNSAGCQLSKRTFKGSNLHSHVNSVFKSYLPS